MATIVHSVDALQDRNFTRAEAALPLGLAIAKPAPAEQARDLEPLVLLNLSRLRQRQDREQEARQLHEQANTQLEQNEPSLPNALFNLLMASVLVDRREYRRAIHFWEQVIQLDEGTEPTAIAQMLWKVGECYNRAGLRDHAAIPLRVARIFRKHHEDPHLSAALITFGNALRKSAPAEAESCHR